MTSNCDDNDNWRTLEFAINSIGIMENANQQVYNLLANANRMQSLVAQSSLNRLKRASSKGGCKNEIIIAFKCSYRIPTWTLIVWSKWVIRVALSNRISINWNSTLKEKNNNLILLNFICYQCTVESRKS